MSTTEELELELEALDIADEPLELEGPDEAENDELAKKLLDEQGKIQRTTLGCAQAVEGKCTPAMCRGGSCFHWLAAVHAARLGTRQMCTDALKRLFVEQEDEEANTGSHLKLIVDAFIQQLPNCVNRDLIDKVRTVCESS